jgi:hypothetical protein
MRNIQRFARTITKTAMEKHIVCVTVTGDAPETLVRMFNHIKSITTVGHSFPIVVDPDDSEYKETFGMDGDGADHIVKIELDGKDVTE